jgi:hypothetical protein
MSDDIESLLRQLASLTYNLRLILERKREYVLHTDVPLQLERSEQVVMAQIADIKAQIAAIEPDNPVLAGPSAARKSSGNQSAGNQSAGNQSAGNQSAGNTINAQQSQSFINRPTGDISQYYGNVTIHHHHGTPADQQPAQAQASHTSDMVERKPTAFMSYAEFDNQYLGGQLEALGKQLSQVVQFVTGDQFLIFQHSDVGWGQNLQQRMDQLLNQSTFLIPIITPGFFRSDDCRMELAHFIEREQRLGRSDLILPVYYVNYAPLNEGAQAGSDELVQMVAGRAYMDWRELRHAALDTPEVRQMLERMAEQMSAALARTS